MIIITICCSINAEIVLVNLLTCGGKIVRMNKFNSKKRKVGWKFPKSKELQKIVEAEGWALYNASLPEYHGKATPWHLFEAASPATEFLVGRTYIMLRIPKGHQTLKQAYRSVREWPAFWMDQTKEALGIAWKSDQTLHLPIFSFLSFETDCVTASYSEEVAKKSGFERPDLTAITYECLINVFKKFFCIVNLTHYDAARASTMLVKLGSLSMEDHCRNINRLLAARLTAETLLTGTVGPLMTVKKGGVIRVPEMPVGEFLERFPGWKLTSRLLNNTP